MNAKRAADAARAAAANSAAEQNGQSSQPGNTNATIAPPGNAEGTDGPVKQENKDTKDEAGGTGTPTSAGTNAPPGTAPPQLPIQQQQQQQQVQAPAPSNQPPQPKQPWELVEDIMNSLKTAFPLLALTMEKMVDQISLRAKTTSEEDIYRFFAALLADALQQWGGRSGVPNDDGELNSMTKENLNKFSYNLSGDLKVSQDCGRVRGRDADDQAEIEKDFIKDVPRLRESIRKLQWWRDTYERNLDARPKTQPLDQGGCSLIEFHHSRFDEVEIPGQYVQASRFPRPLETKLIVQHVDQNEEFIKIARFAPRAELGRGHGHCFRRIIMVGSNGSHYTFNVQMPAARHCRREERLTQLFRIMNRQVVSARAGSG